MLSISYQIDPSKMFVARIAHYADTDVTAMPPDYSLIYEADLQGDHRAALEAMGVTVTDEAWEDTL